MTERESNISAMGKVVTEQEDSTAEVIRDIQLMASGNSAESAMDCHRRVRGVIAEQIFDSHGCKVGKND